MLSVLSLGAPGKGGMLVLSARPFGDGSLGSKGTPLTKPFEDFRDKPANSRLIPSGTPGMLCSRIMFGRVDVGSAVAPGPSSLVDITLDKEGGKGLKPTDTFFFTGIISKFNAPRLGDIRGELRGKRCM
jgi:hypothetical protein